MKKIHYNIEQLTNAIATGLLGLATLGPMTSCEKNEPDIDTEMTNSEDEENNQEQKGDDGQVSENDVVYGDYEGVTGNTYGYLYKDGTYRADQKVVNENGTFLHCSIAVAVKDNEGNEKGVNYLIVLKKQDNGDLVYKRCLPKDKKTLDIFNKYRIEDKYYTERGFNPPVLPLNIDNL